MAQFVRYLRKLWSRHALGNKIYFSLTGILLPVFALTIFLQSIMTRPLLDEEVRLVGLSVCRTLATDILAFRLLNKQDQLEARLVEMTWLQPSLLRLDVITAQAGKTKIFASNVAENSEATEVDNELLSEINSLDFSEAPSIWLKTDENRGRFWEILYPVRDHKHAVAYIHAIVSLQLVNQVVGTFSKIALVGDALAVVLLMLLLTYYVRRMIRTETENTQLTEQLHEAQRRLFLNEKLAVMGQLTASFAHEIGTPLNSLSGHLQLLKDEVASEPALNRLEIIESQVTRIEGIVKDFLASTHTPAQQRQLVDVRPLIERIAKLVGPRVAAIGATIKTSVPEQLEPVRAVPTDLEQVLLNLANNAIDALEHNPAGSHREICVDAGTSQSDNTGKSLEITVSDTGQGIESKDLKQILKPFFTTKAPGQGTGLGLTISQQLVKKYNGRLDIDSALGKGTSVKVSIPYEPS